MQYIIYALIALMLIVSIYTIFFAGDKTKGYISVVAIVVVIFAYLYERQSSSIRDKNVKILFHFNQGSTLICGDVRVDKENFNIVSRSFIGKDGTKFSGLKVFKQDCNLENEKY